MDFILTEESKGNIKALCEKLAMLGWLLNESDVKGLRTLGSVLIESADEIADEVDGCVPEGVE